MAQMKHLTVVQKNHLRQLMAEMNTAEAAAQRFLGYCAAECGIELGNEWRFNLEQMHFVRQEQEEPTYAEYDQEPERANGSRDERLPAY